MCILLAQWALETAEGHGMWCWNIGNQKQPTDDHDFFEITTTEYIQGFAREVRGARFRAFEDLDDGLGRPRAHELVHLTVNVCFDHDGLERGDNEGYVARVPSKGCHELLWGHGGRGRKLIGRETRFVSFNDTIS